jgi:hypothetical protein
MTARGTQGFVGRAQLSAAVVALVVVICSLVAAAAAAEPVKPRAIGDSFTAGFVSSQRMKAPNNRVFLTAYPLAVNGTMPSTSPVRSNGIRQAPEQGRRAVAGTQSPAVNSLQGRPDLIRALRLRADRARHRRQAQVDLGRSRADAEMVREEPDSEPRLRVARRQRIAS